MDTKSNETTALPGPAPVRNRVKFLVEKADDTLLLSDYDKNNNVTDNTNSKANKSNSKLTNEYIWEFNEDEGNLRKL